MPKGVPKAGFRNRGKNKTRIAPFPIRYETTIPEIKETDQEIEERISDRFTILSELTNAAIQGEVRALIVSGPAGLGKSFTVEQAVSSWNKEGEKYAIIKGYVKATGLYKLLYQYRHPGKVLIFDDADSIFFDETALNLLKAVSDTNDKRVVSYLSEGTLIDEDNAERIPKSFEFDGSIIFITNYDFDAMIDRGHKLAPHLQAMVSRAHYIDLSMKNKRDFLVRIHQVIKQGLLKKIGLNDVQQTEVLEFIDGNSNSLRELSLRIALKIATIRKANSPRWKNVAKVTCCRN